MNTTVSADTLSVTCSGWTANDQTCTFEVRTLTQDCGFTSDAATNGVTLSGEYCIGYIIFLVGWGSLTHLHVPSLQFWHGYGESSGLFDIII